MPVERFLKSLQNAYSSADFDLVLEHYHAPLAVVKDDFTITIENELQLQTHIRRMLADQKLGRIQYFDTKLIEEYAVGDSLTLVRYSLTAHYLSQPALPRARAGAHVPAYPMWWQYQQSDPDCRACAQHLKIKNP